MLPCCHWYHTECIKVACLRCLILRFSRVRTRCSDSAVSQEWLLHSRLCPLCKAPVVPEELGM